MEIGDSARKRGHSDADMLHAIRQALAIFTVPGQDVTLYLGPAHSGTVLEVGVADADGDNPDHPLHEHSQVIHDLAPQR